MIQRPCLDCGTLTTHSVSRCAVCAPKAATRWKASRPDSPYRSPAWRKLSLQKRKERPWCEICGQQPGNAENPLTADHIKPLSEGGDLIVPTYMLRTLCRRCHGKITKHK